MPLCCKGSGCIRPPNCRSANSSFPFPVGCNRPGVPRISPQPDSKTDLLKDSACCAKCSLLILLCLAPSVEPYQSESKRRAATMSGPSDVQIQTLERFIEAWQKWSAEDMLECFSSDVRQRSMPLSLGIPARQRKEVEAVLPKLVQVVHNYEVCSRR